MRGGPTRFLGLKLLSKCITRNTVWSRLFTFMLRRTRGTRKREIYTTLIGPDGGLGGGVYGEGGLRRIRAEVMQRCANATNFRPAAA